MIAGDLRGRRLLAPAGRATRPTADRVREALFDILGDRIVGSVFLDAYAGTGAVGIEALSRGAASVTFVENQPENVALIRRNIETIAAPEARVRLLPWDLTHALRTMSEWDRKFDIVFLDPPYGGGELDRGLRLLARACPLGEGAVVIAEHESVDPAPVPDRLAPVRTVTYGRVALTFFERVRAADEGRVRPVPPSPPSR